ncbi:aminodeoxychorismate synthase, component I [Longispora fulva]|uniref:aminodeoxychorismate synthase n=1 Tax=Longispora fulva TaxID=619741 RepID=A0A8J7GKY0_9ACTN|nr:aminodeoxychorismate synthase component I [Longispora fulva]MBG6141519.1 para-aminobenzoate synthetase [Longispora fulva]GIG59330.1 aminodeoxychorismate synthase, component I [Longispora fulva]
MRTLLVDNHDSFTYNLFHHLAEVTGHEPEVVRNDDPHWRPERLRGFDNVVISPGPGTPRRAADLGLSRDLVEHCDIPLLGVCLGHQAIAHLSGACVDRAPEPRHGRVSEVLHDGAGLFAGLPNPFEAVRYHSLAVTDLPASLVATAHTRDGVLMGLRHRTRPQWGVQFHPESICTEHGHQLLANFTRLTAEWQRAHDVTPGRAARRDRLGTPRPAPTTKLKVLVEACPTRWNDEVVYDQLFRAAGHSFWLDASRPGDGTGRFSVMGDATGPLARVVTADVWDGTVTVTGSAGTRKVGVGFWDWLDRDLAGLAVDVPALPFDFALGWVGYLGYELKAQSGGDRAHRSPYPDAAMVFADRALVFDHVEQVTYLLALAADDEEPARDWLRATADRLAGLAGWHPLTPDPPFPQLVYPRHNRDEYLDLIASCQADIAAGETYEVCLTTMVEARVPVDPWLGYRLMRRFSPAPFGALLDFGDLSVLSTSPERFLRIGADGSLESRPIKGTRPRGASAEEDELLRKDLATSEKDRSENLMIVDLVRNDLGRCAVVGSVRVPKLFDVESYATVHQLVSTIVARRRADASAVDCVRAAFPGGSMTGAPKERTMRIIDALEGGPRGVYAGAIGYLSLTGAADLSIAIRTAVVRGDRTRYGVGGAIVALSDPEEEFEETAVKAAPLLRLVGTEFPDRR